MATFDELITSLRQEFGEAEAGKKFEVFCKWFLENDPEWSRAIDKVWLWDEYPNKWQRQDLGTDLVFRDKEGLIWAVQAKCYAEHRSTTKGDMNSFLADTGRPEVDRRLWLQTTNKIEAKALKTCKGQDKPVTIFNLNDFREARIDYPSSFSELGLAKVKEKPTPDPHQVSAIQDVVSGFQAADRGQMIMACGTGKTFTTLWIKEALEAETTLVLLPSLSLLSQTMREWAWAGNTDFAILNICSDKSVGRKTEDMDPADAAFPVTSDLNEITAFLKRPDAKVVFCTYQSSELISQAQLDEAIPAFDLAIADEAHRCAGKADAGFATILDGSKIRASKRLFTTATPRYAGKSVKDAGKVRDVAVVGMDDETVFGPVLHKLTFGQAIDYKPEPLLNDYQVVIIGVDEPMVREWIDNYEIVSTDPDKQTDARTLAAKIGLIKAIKDYDLERVISFHSRVKGAEEFSEEMATILELVEPENRPDGEFLSDYVSGAMAAGDRKEKIDRLKQLEGYDRGILTNARCLAEGVDVPSLDGIAFIDPKSSQIDIIQAVGRAIRKVRGEAAEKKGTIVLPVFIEDGDDHEAAIEASNFKPVWDVLKALRAHDDVLADQLDQYRTNMAKNTDQLNQNISDKIIFDIPRFVDPTFAKALRTVLAEATTASWEFWFGLLEQFAYQRKHANVPQHHTTANGLRLGNWVGMQRANRDRLDTNRIERLNGLGFVWDAFQEQWEQGFSELEKFEKRESHCLVRRGFKTDDGYSLGIWVQNQRRLQESMPIERKRRLDELGFSWDPIKDQWEQGFSELKKFMEREGHCKIPHKYEGKDGYKLRTFVLYQRKHKSVLSDERIKRLDDLGFIWDPIKDQWEQGFNELKKFREREGHCLVPHSLKSRDGFGLGVWVGTQRKAKDTLEPELIERLDGLGFVWDPLKDQWEQSFSELKKFKERQGHLKIPSNYKSQSGLTLYNWANRQRRIKNQLTPERIERLDALGFIWDPLKDQWEQGFNELKKFREREGHCLVTIRFRADSGFDLGRWVLKQRQESDRLTQQCIKRLDGLGFVWNPLKDQWEQGFSELKKFKEREGHCRVPISWATDDGFRLGVWVGTQRKAKDTLEPELIERLDGLGFVWDPRTEQWEQFFSELLKFKEHEGHCLVRHHYTTESGLKLGNWVLHQRKKKGHISQERIERLDALGFIWDPLKDQWEQGFNDLKKFKEQEGHCKPHRSYRTESGYALSDWVGTQRRAKETLDQNRIERLNALGFVWDPVREQWEQGLSELKKFKEREGHCLVGINYQSEPNGFYLGNWVAVQRKRRKHLDDEQMIKLNEIDFEWEPNLAGKKSSK